MSHVHRHDPNEEHRLQQFVMVALTLSVSVALVVFGIHLASGPTSHPASAVAQSNKPSTQPSVSAATVAPVVQSQATANATAAATTQSMSTATSVAQAQPTPVAEPTPTSTPTTAPAITDGASPAATAAIQQFIDRNGAMLAVGDAVGNPFTDSATGIVGQYYSHAVIEYHPELAQTSYAVELSRIGVAAAETEGILNSAPFQPLSADTKPDENCSFVKATGHRLCNGFRAFWSSHGLDLGDSGTSYRESLALFGYPISEEFVDPGTGLVVQYFERSKLEYDPSQPQHQRVRTNLSSDMVQTRWGAQIVNGVQSLIAGD